MEKGSPTLYVSGLNDRVKPADLISLLYELFTSYGEVISVDIAKGKSVTGKTIRGTAFVSLKTISQATSAMRNLKSYYFLGKEIRIDFAQKKSDAVAKFMGNFKPRFKPLRRRKDDMVE